MNLGLQLKFVLGLIMLFVAAVIRFFAVYGGGGISLSDDWTDGSLKFHLLVAAFLFIFWVIFGPVDVKIESSEELDLDPGAGSDATSGTAAAGSGGADADGGDGGD